MMGKCEYCECWDAEDDDTTGFCRRHPPVSVWTQLTVREQEPREIGMYVLDAWAQPVTHSSSGCYEFIPKAET